MKVRDSGMQGQEFLRSLSSFESQLTSLLLPCGSMRLLDQVVAPGRGHDLDVLHAQQQTTDLRRRGRLIHKAIATTLSKE